MQTTLADRWRGRAEAEEAAAIVRKCVHCGFCTAACPTYRLLGDELDGPRGRIYLVKRVLEGAVPTAKTQLHLDRCLTCRACEPACPSGVEYGRLADAGRRLVDESVRRPLHERAVRAALRAVLTRPRIFAALLGLARQLRPVLPARLRTQLRPARPAGEWPRHARPRRVLLIGGCVQPALLPNVDAATARVLDALGYETVVPPAAGCCGAIRQHLGDPAGALEAARRNVDAWWPQLEAGAEAVIVNASGCGTQVRDYAHLLRDDPAYSAKAARLVAATRDVAEFVAEHAERLAVRVAPAAAAGDAAGAAVAGEATAAAAAPSATGRGGRPVRVVFHAPCSLQHGLRIRGVVESLLARLGAEVLPYADAQLCCGSAGTYSLLQPALANDLRTRKLAALERPAPDLILSANVGCIAHLDAGAQVPVRHWIEWVDEMLGRDGGNPVVRGAETGD
ncbi:MAG: glycolate oxidase subunit GlcF [Steroidobacteraceae bacterium]|jgi:glycolate oxidase iron-sulfur subunit|nr:glycolate oxidase subunit GlcF [Steroidobacteraceae bacterium]